MTKKSKVLTKNKKAAYDYMIKDRYEAGMALKGFEAKQFSSGHVSLVGAHVKIIKDEAFLVGALFGTANVSPQTRDVKLLLNRHEIDKIESSMIKGGCSAVPIEVYYLEGHKRMKVEIGVGKGKKKSDKRRALKEKAQKMEERRGTH